MSKALLILDWTLCLAHDDRPRPL